jgi:DNA-binding transcriptional ArsR family regulator
VVEQALQQFMSITKALSEENRVRILLFLILFRSRRLNPFEGS